MPTITINQKSETRNSKQIRNSKLEVSNFGFRISYFSRLFRFSNFVFRICLVFLISNFGFTLPVLAGSDPKTSSPYATASIPSLSVEGDTQAPSIPVLIRPSSSTITSDNTPEYVWNGSTDPNGNTVLYTLYLNTAATYLGISNLGNSAGLGYTSRLEAGDLYLTPSTGLPDGLYSWHIVAGDLSLNTAQSAIWSFTIDTQPPPLSLTQLDTYQDPVITEGANFDIAGPKEFSLTVSSDPFITVQLTLTSDQDPFSLTAQTDSSGLATFHLNPALATYSLTLVAIDQAANTTTLPEFTLTITQAQITVPLPPLPGLPPSYSIPYTPYTLPSLTATVNQLATRSPIASLTALLLALATGGLLYFLKKPRPNLILLDSALRPLGPATIYHSLPYTPGVKGSHTPGVLSILHTPHSKLYIPHLSRYSTLTIRTEDKTTVLSISSQQMPYQIIL